MSPVLLNQTNRIIHALDFLSKILLLNQNKPTESISLFNYPNQLCKFRKGKKKYLLLEEMRNNFLLISYLFGNQLRWIFWLLILNEFRIKNTNNPTLIDENRSGMAWEIPNFQIEFLSTSVDFYQQDSFCFIYVRCFLSVLIY